MSHHPTMTNILGIVFITGVLTNWTKTEFTELKCDLCPIPYWHKAVEYYDVIPQKAVWVQDGTNTFTMEFCEPEKQELRITNMVSDPQFHVPSLVVAKSNALKQATISFPTNFWRPNDKLWHTTDPDVLFVPNHPIYTVPPGRFSTPVYEVPPGNFSTPIYGAPPSTPIITK